MSPPPHLLLLLLLLLNSLNKLWQGRPRHQERECSVQASMISDRSPGKMSILFIKASLIYFCTRAILGGTKTGGCPGTLIDGCWDNIRLFMRWPPCQSSSSPDINRIHLNIFAVAKYVFKYLDWFVFGILLESIMPKTFLHFSQLHQTLLLSPLWFEISASKVCLPVVESFGWGVHKLTVLRLCRCTIACLGWTPTPDALSC